MGYLWDEGPGQAARLGLWGAEHACVVADPAPDDVLMARPALIP
jgi:hypothetical protein